MTSRDGRAYDQVVHDIAIQRLPVRFMLDRAGLVGADGATHEGSCDVAYLGCLPGFVLMAASDGAELMHMVATAVAPLRVLPSLITSPAGLRPCTVTGRGRIRLLSLSAAARSE